MKIKISGQDFRLCIRNLHNHPQIHEDRDFKAHLSWWLTSYDYHMTGKMSCCDCRNRL